MCRLQWSNVGLYVQNNSHIFWNGMVSYLGKHAQFWCAKRAWELLMLRGSSTLCLAITSVWNGLTNVAPNNHFVCTACLIGQSSKHHNYAEQSTAVPSVACRGYPRSVRPLSRTQKQSVLKKSRIAHVCGQLSILKRFAQKHQSDCLWTQDFHIGFPLLAIEALYQYQSEMLEFSRYLDWAGHGGTVAAWNQFTANLCWTWLFKSSVLPISLGQSCATPLSLLVPSLLIVSLHPPWWLPSNLPGPPGTNTSLLDSQASPQWPSWGWP